MWEVAGNPAEEGQVGRPLVQQMVERLRSSEQGPIGRFKVRPGPQAAMTLAQGFGNALRLAATDHRRWG